MTNQDSTIVTKPPNSFPQPQKYDFIFRASGSSWEDFKVTWVQPTSAVAFSFQNFLSVLLEIIESQVKQLEFDGYYISYLLGHIDEKEFEGISEKYVSKKAGDINPEQLKNKIEVLLSLRGHDITPREIAQYLHCSEDDVTKAILLLQG